MLTAEASAETTLDPDLLNRYRAAVDVVRADPGMSTDERLELLYLVLRPTPDILAATDEAPALRGGIEEIEELGWRVAVYGDGGNSGFALRAARPGHAPVRVRGQTFDIATARLEQALGIAAAA